MQLLLPIYANSGARIERHLFETTRRELTKKFGGLTVYSHAPAKGFWKKGPETARDEIVVFEVMAKRIGSLWWRRYRRKLEKRFVQEQIIVRLAGGGFSKGLPPIK